MKSKRIIAISLITALTLGLTACGSGEVLAPVECTSESDATTNISDKQNAINGVSDSIGESDKEGHFVYVESLDKELYYYDGKYYCNYSSSFWRLDKDYNTELQIIRGHAVAFIDDYVIWQTNDSGSVVKESDIFYWIPLDDIANLEGDEKHIIDEPDLEKYTGICYDDIKINLMSYPIDKGDATFKLGEKDCLYLEIPLEGAYDHRMLVKVLKDGECSVITEWYYSYDLSSGKEEYYGIEICGDLVEVDSVIYALAENWDYSDNLGHSGGEDGAYGYVSIDSSGSISFYYVGPKMSSEGFYGCWDTLYYGKEENWREFLNKSTI